MDPLIWSAAICLVFCSAVKISFDLLEYKRDREHKARMRQLMQGEIIWMTPDELLRRELRLARRRDVFLANEMVVIMAVQRPTKPKPKQRVNWLVEGF